MELYHDNNDIHALQPNDVTRRHLHITHSPTVFVDSMTEVPSPISKALFSTEPENQPALLDFLRAQPWYDRYEIVASSSSLVELTAKGANKGGMVRRLAELLGIRQENVACVGDHANDISMLNWAGMAFAPANALPEVRALPCVRTLPDCRDHAIAALIQVLDEKYSAIRSQKGVPKGRLSVFFRPAAALFTIFCLTHRRKQGMIHFVTIL